MTSDDTKEYFFSSSFIFIFFPCVNMRNSAMVVVVHAGSRPFFLSLSLRRVCWVSPFSLCLPKDDPFRRVHLFSFFPFFSPVVILLRARRSWSALAATRSTKEKVQPPTGDPRDLEKYPQFVFQEKTYWKESMHRRPFV